MALSSCADSDAGALFFFCFLTDFGRLSLADFGRAADDSSATSFVGGVGSFFFCFLIDFGRDALDGFPAACVGGPGSAGSFFG